MVARSDTTGEGPSITSTPAGVLARGLLPSWVQSFNPGSAHRIRSRTCEETQSTPPETTSSGDSPPDHEEDDMIKQACVGGGHGWPRTGTGTPVGVPIEF